MKNIIIYREQCILSKLLLYDFKYLELKTGFYDMWPTVLDSDENHNKKMNFDLILFNLFHSIYRLK